MADSFTPPAQVQANAKRGLELREKHGRGGTEVGVARARDLSNGKGISLDTIKRMTSYFARHEVDKQGEGWGTDSAGYIAWLLWGGDAGWSWAKGIVKDQEKKDKSMTQDLAYSYAGIIKSEKQSDGTIKVYGKATDDSIDIDQQICDEDWLKEAMPHWFKTGGNIREQHSSIAAGVATDYESKSDGHYIEALIVDPVSVKKIEAGVLKGFSIGIRGPRVIRDAKASGGRIVGGQIVEVSVVDRPANSNAKMTIAKSVDGKLVEVEQTYTEQITPASIAKTIKPVGITGSKVESMEIVTKSDSPIDAIVDAVENVVHEVAEAVADVAEAVADVAEQIADKAEEVADATDESDESEKSALLADVKKYDEGLFNAAIKAIGDLIAVEAREAIAGHDESESIHHLLKAIKHLKKWYRGEVAGGEVENPVVAFLEDESDHIEAEEQMIGMEMSADADKEALVEMCDKCDKAVDECKCADKSALPDLATETIIEKAVKSAREAVEVEIEQLKSASANAEQRATQLEAELADALSKTAAGGPVRAGLNNKISKHDVNDLLEKASDYRAKASATEDRLLAAGYSELADDLESKARKS